METIKETFQIFLNKKYITQNDFDRLAPRGSQPGILYGLAKIPIVGNCLPCRSILNAINTPRYKIAMFFVPILDVLTTNEFTIQDSFKYAKEVRKQHKQYIMASLDADLLLPNISLDETIKICSNELFKDMIKRKFMD